MDRILCIYTLKLFQRIKCYILKQSCFREYIMANVSSLSVAQIAEEYGKLFYIISPHKTSFGHLSEIPDYVQQAMPYMVTLIILEAVINIWLGKRHNLADSVTSISCGLLMTMVGLLTKVRFMII